MSRSALLITGLAVAVVVALAIGVGGAVLVTTIRSPDMVSTVLMSAPTRWTAAIALAAFAFFAVAHLVPAAAEISSLASLHRRLAAADGAFLSPDEFSTLARRTSLARACEEFVAALWRPEGETRNWWATTPAAVLFERATTAQEAVAETMGRVGYIALGAGFVGLLFVASAIAWGVPTRPDLAGRIAVFGGGTFVGVAIIVLARTMALVQRALVIKIAGRVDRFFPALNGNSMLTQLERMLTRQTSRVLEKVSAPDQRFGEAVAVAVGKATMPVGERLAQLAGQLETDRTAAAKRLIDGSLEAFAAEYRQRFGAAQEETARTIAATREAAEALRQRIEESARHAHADQERREAQLAAMLQSGIAAATEHHGAATQAAIEQLDTVLRRFAEQGGDELRRAAAAFAQLRAILETLSISVLPALNRLVETQDAIEAALKSSHAKDGDVAETARALGEAVRLARETVERQVVLAKELTAAPPRIEKPARPEPPPQRRADQPETLVDALDSLRTETDEALRSLPRI